MFPPDFFRPGGSQFKASCVLRMRSHPTHVEAGVVYIQYSEHTKFYIVYTSIFKKFNSDLLLLRSNEKWKKH